MNQEVVNIQLPTTDQSSAAVDTVGADRRIVGAPASIRVWADCGSGLLSARAPTDVSISRWGPLRRSVPAVPSKRSARGSQRVRGRLDRTANGPRGQRLRLSVAPGGGGRAC